MPHYADLPRWSSTAGGGPPLQGRIAGQGGPWIHWLSGNGFCGGVYWPMLRPLARDHQLFLHDIEGQGDSGVPPRFRGSRTMLRAADGTMIYWRALGFVNAGADRAAAFFAGEDLAPASMEAAPYFDAPQGERDWMTCRSFIARGTLGSRSAEIDVFRMQPE